MPETQEHVEDPPSLSAAREVVELIGAGLDAGKCRRCGKMSGVIDKAERAFAASEDPGLRAMANNIGEFRGRTLKQASGDFGCGGCWGSKARKELSRSLKGVKAGKRKASAPEPVVIEAGGPPRADRDRRGTFSVEVADGLIKCMHYKRRGRLAHIVSGRDATAIVAAAAEAGLIKCVEDAAYLGLELARAEAALAADEPYAARPWPASRRLDRGEGT